MLSARERDMVTAAAQAGADRGAAAAPRFRPAVVLDVDPTNTTASCSADGPDGGPFDADIVAPVAIYPGDRVQIAFVPPHGALIVGRLAGDWDDWHEVGGDGEPAYVTGWGPGGGTGSVGANAQAVPMFTRRGDRVELRGVAERSSGASLNIFVLPQGYWPENDIAPRASGIAGAATFIIIDQLTGTVTSGGPTTIVFDGISFLAKAPTE